MLINEFERTYSAWPIRNLKVSVSMSTYRSHSPLIRCTTTHWTLPKKPRKSIELKIDDLTHFWWRTDSSLIRRFARSPITVSSLVSVPHCHLLLSHSVFPLSCHVFLFTFINPFYHLCVIYRLFLFLSSSSLQTWLY